MKVVVVHGLFMTGLVMFPLVRRITQHGYDVFNLTYNTVNPNTEKMFGQIDAFVGEEPFVLVGHSMGGVMATQYLVARPNNRAVAVVTLGTPHQGAKIAKYINKLGLKDVMLRGSAPYLMPRRVDWPHSARLYSMAGGLPLGVLPFILQGTERPSDGVVLIEETKVEGMYQHKIMKQTHESMLVSRDVADWVVDVLDAESTRLQGHGPQTDTALACDESTPKNANEALAS